MDWLSQNWIWVLVGLGLVFYFFRGGMHGLSGHGAGHGGLIGMEHDAHGAGSAEPERSPQPEARAAANAPEAAIDPVTGAAVRTAQALTSMYQGKIYFFAAKENRDRFEAAPQEYAPKATGYSMQAPAENEYRPRRRGGC